MQTISKVCHDDVIKWKHFPRYWPFVRGIHRWPVNSPHKGQWCGALVFSLIYAWINGWENNREAGDSRCHRVHYEVIVMIILGEMSFADTMSDTHALNMPFGSLVPSLHLKQCWSVVNHTPETYFGISVKPYSGKIPIFSFSENAFENTVCKLWAILFKPQCKNNKYTGSSRVQCDYLVGCSTQNANTIPTDVHILYQISTDRPHIAFRLLTNIPHITHIWPQFTVHYYRHCRHCCCRHRHRRYHIIIVIIAVISIMTAIIIISSSSSSSSWS